VRGFRFKAVRDLMAPLADFDWWTRIGLPACSFHEHALMVDWPWLDDPRCSPPDDPFGPWHRDGVPYEHYRLHGPYADGALGAPILTP
jgi:hypothetical protein